MGERTLKRSSSAFGHGTLPGHIYYMVFDCLHVNGHSLLSRPLEERQRILHELGPAFVGDAVKLTEAFPAVQSRRLWTACAAMSLEGVIMKRKASFYRPGYCSPDWIKVPIRHTEEFIVMGYLAASPNRLSSLILAQYDQHGKIAYAGLVGTGLSEEARGMLLTQPHALKRKTSPCAPVPVLRDHFRELRTDVPPQWIKPRLVVQVEYRKRTGCQRRLAVRRDRAYCGKTKPAPGVSTMSTRPEDMAKAD
jgi:bifunctional non-homologous end joining protein LigD